jgi:hypothetical protein
MMRDVRRLLGPFLLSTSAFVSAAAPPAITVTAAARSIQPGELVILTIATAAPTDAVRVRAFDHDLSPFRVDASTWQVLVGIDLDASTGAHPVAIDTGASPAAAKTTYSLVVKPKAFPTRTLVVDDAFVNPPAAEMKRIQEDQDRLNRVWQSSAKTKLWTGPFIRPVAEAANSAFGKRSVYNGQPRGSHGGADFESPAGTPVKAPGSGRVALAGDLYFTGNTVVIDHGLGLFSIFAHFSAIDVHEGDAVTGGQVVGKVGATGRVTGPHLHWAIRVAGARVDPLSLLALVGAGTTSSMK